MMNFITLVLAFVVANFITAAIGYVIMTNRKVLGWYMKRSMKVGKLIAEDLENEDE